MPNPRKIYRSPSHFRHQTRRRDECMTKTMSINEVSTPVSKMPVAEEAKEIAVEKSTADLTVQPKNVNLMNTDENTSIKTADEVDGNALQEIEKEDFYNVDDNYEGQAEVVGINSTEHCGYIDFDNNDVTGNKVAVIDGNIA